MLAGSALVVLRKEIFRYVIKPTIAEIGLDRPGAAALIHGTFMAESNYDHIVQMNIPKTGGMGFGQCEQLTYNDHRIWLTNKFNSELYDKILAACMLTELPKEATALQWHTKLAVCICRVDYYRVRTPIPLDAEGLSHYHKTWYNSRLGKADPIANIPIFQKALDDANE